MNQKSIFAFSDRSVPLPLEKIGLKKEWSAQQVWDDFNKKYVTELIEEPTDLLLIDALSCVIPVHEVSWGEYRTTVTYSEAMKESCELLKNSGELKVSPQSIRFSEADVSRSVKAFCRKITAVYPQNHIFIHKAKYPDLFLHGAEVVRYSPAELKKRAKNQLLLEQVYCALEENLPGANLIEMPPAAFSRSMKNAFSFGKEYADFVASSIFLYEEPAIAQKMLAKDYSELFLCKYPKATEEKAAQVNVQEIIDNYEYRLELYNQKFRNYEEKFLELYNMIMDTDYPAMSWPDKELSFSEFIDLKKQYPLKYKKKHSKAWYLFVYPWTQAGKFFSYVRKYGLAEAIRKVKRKISSKLRGI